ncbi:MAG: hypothetical protein A4E48_00235 [Methanosaeta sp. PtaU1.Bin060]|nr:MAG: hypothetical protein A4E48_00235 [Methanosaeta sp. PtaU1.Bin060]
MPESVDEAPKIKRKRGRPPGIKLPYGSHLLTPEIQDKVVKAVILGMPDRFIPAFAGISRNSYYGWLKRGSEAIKRSEKTHKPIPATEKPFADFNLAVDWAMSQCIARCLRSIDRASQGVINDDGTFALAPSWQAAMTLLERKFPDDFGRRDRIEHSGNEEKPIVVTSLAEFSLNAAKKAAERRQRS